MLRITASRVFAFIVVAAGAFLWPSLSWMHQVDECAVSGGAMDYAVRVCGPIDSVSTPPPRAWYVRPARRELLVGATGVLILIAVFAARDRIEKSDARGNMT
jgi:hypothetical protein